MREKSKCPYTGDIMCSCDAITSGDAEAIAAHMFQNRSALKMELDYGTLEVPAPYRLCTAGICKVCGGRLCFSMNLPDYLYGDGLLAVVYHHMNHLYPDGPNQFTALFHEEDRPAARRWLERNLSPAAQAEPAEAVRLYNNRED